MRRFLAGLVAGALLYRYARMARDVFADEAGRTPPWY